MLRALFALCLLATTSTVDGRRVAARPKAGLAIEKSAQKATTAVRLPPLSNGGKEFCQPEAQCSVCQGDCDTDADCKSGLVCWKRNYKTAVPGCESGGEGDIEHHDYCTLEAEAAQNWEKKYVAFDPKDGVCPKVVPLSAGQHIPSIVIVTILEATNLPWSFTDTPDPHVEFWTGADGHRWDEYWMARTPAIEDKTNPIWGWTCLVTYDNVDPRISFEVYDADTVTSHDLLGMAFGNLLEIFRSDEDRDGIVEHEFQLQEKKGVLLTSGGKTSTLKVRFQVVREPTLYTAPERIER